MTRPRLIIARGRDKALGRRHPWVFSGAVKQVEGLPQDDPVIAAFVEMTEPGYGTSMQCGFCTPGFVMEAHALLEKNPDPTKEEIVEAMSGHICRCGCYQGIERSVELAAEKMHARCEHCTNHE